MAKRRPKLTAKQRELHAKLSLLTDDQLVLFRVMNDPTASIDDRMEAAVILAPIMHKPLPVRYVTMEEAERLLEEYRK